MSVLRTCPTLPARAALLVALVAAGACGSRGSGTTAGKDAAPAAPPADAIAVDATPVDAGPATRALRGPVETLLGRLGRLEVAPIWDEAHPSFRLQDDRTRMERMMVLLVEPLGAFQAVEAYQDQAGRAPGENIATGTARFANGVAPFELAFRDDGETPRLSFFKLDLPPELRREQTPEEARALVDQVLAAALTGDLAKVRRFAHPALDEKLDAAQATELKAIVGALGTPVTIDVTRQEECKGQCFEVTLTGPKARASASLKLTRIYGRWHVLGFELVRS